ncbi:hypothetical protein BDV93DRAFT_554482 [Ceratobasidium sp. AG-I]|nr:hypothetical protein BDV93DRAFT_554482 [Ceratobasidium sp. AG-I]
MSLTPFESRTGTYEFHTPREAMAYSGQVVRWAHISRLPLYFNYSKIGSDHSPLWIAAPVLNGEELSSEFLGYGGSKPKAKENACMKMALSGHCVSLLDYALLVIIS